MVVVDLLDKDADRRYTDMALRQIAISLQIATGILRFWASTVNGVVMLAHALAHALARALAHALAHA